MIKPDVIHTAALLVRRKFYNRAVDHFRSAMVVYRHTGAARDRREAREACLHMLAVRASYFGLKKDLA